MQSIWSLETEFTKRKSLEQDISVDVAVIGAGMAGLLTAYLLKEKGVQVAVIEANTIASGQTKNTTAKITAQHNLIYNKLIIDVGERKARQYAVANQLAVEKYANLIQRNGIDCNFERKSAYVYSMDNNKLLKEELRAMQMLDLDAEFVERTTLPFPIKGAIKLSHQAQFNPLKFLKPITEELTIYEHTIVHEVKENTIITNHGKVKAEHIVFATHFPFVNVPGFYFARMHQQRSYVVAFENCDKLDGMYIDEADGGYSFRNYGNLLLVGGAGHRTGENGEGGAYEQIREQAKQWFPNAIERYHWSAQDCMTLDGVPYIGHFAPLEKNWYVATGFNKWGMTSSMVSAMIISDMIVGQNTKFAEVFSPQRFVVSASIKTLLEDGMKAVSGLSTQALLIPKTHFDELPNGHGGVVEYNGMKVGVYKNEKGEAFVVSTRCPHLGCQLEWNPDEKTWDCPCHGSRFDFKGNLINNPSTTNLIKY
ncbi:FAD-dependent oxidoreductase [Paludicola sp. MB14-C6]|uniref:FAD-dependent oxidoreductase n=1 Tax=Paludihabitans sp. MB14-C6 TaxID=3070656 RepID=UPI0027DDAD3B|nr:FAD-dependent oxidoreductase [Paludicola sp. MB14-C6]WMJ23849.1 FAD-dependent oxidoreductase [Paludicola sp. MB14-C6]